MSFSNYCPTTVIIAVKPSCLMAEKGSPVVKRSREGHLGPGKKRRPLWSPVHRQPLLSGTRRWGPKPNKRHKHTERSVGAEQDRDPRATPETNKTIHAWDPPDSRPCWLYFLGPCPSGPQQLAAHPAQLTPIPLPVTRAHQGCSPAHHSGNYYTCYVAADYKKTGNPFGSIFLERSR